MSEDKTALQKAVDILARREHSRFELRHKLAAKEFSEEEIEAALHRLGEKGLQSDERFTESYITTRYQRGQGPYKIKAELKQKGVDESLIDQLMRDEQYDWYQQASRVYEKKYGDQPLSDFKDKLKRSRFLQQRGFAADHIQNVFEMLGLVEE